MSKVVVTESSLQAIADAIRDKLNVQTEYTPSQMAATIESIETSGELTPASGVSF